jgi:hypothetical protein
MTKQQQKNFAKLKKAREASSVRHDNDEKVREEKETDFSKLGSDPIPFRERQERLEQDRRDYEEFKRKDAFRKRLEEARNKEASEPVKEPPQGYGPTGIFPRVFLERCAELFKNKMVAFVEQWDDAAHNYLDWLEVEGFSRSESVELLNAALERADLDMGRFPVC